MKVAAAVFHKRKEEEFHKNKDSIITTIGESIIFRKETSLITTTVCALHLNKVT